MKNLTHVNEFNYKVPYWNPSRGYRKIRTDVIQRIDKVLDSGNMILGEEVEEFEQRLAEYVGTKYAVGLNSGTDAIYLSLKALGIGPGDEVITVSNTFIATISEIARVGAIPVLIDVGKDGLMDVSLVEPAITSRTKAIIPVHLEGDMVDMQKLLKLAQERGLYVIEDAAQAMGAFRYGKAGSMGITGCFSFYPAKIFGAYGDAGAITTNDKKIYDKVRDLRDHNLIGKLPTEAVEEYGMNSRLDSIQAAVLNVKFDSLESCLAARAAAAQIYNSLLVGMPEVTLPTIRKGRVYQDYVIRAERRNDLAMFLDRKGIKVRGHNLESNHRYTKLGFSVILQETETYNALALRLPLSAEIRKDEIQYVGAAIREFYA